VENVAESASPVRTRRFGLRVKKTKPILREVPSERLTRRETISRAWAGACRLRRGLQRRLSTGQARAPRQCAEQPPRSIEIEPWLARTPMPIPQSRGSDKNESDSAKFPHRSVSLRCSAIDCGQKMYLGRAREHGSRPSIGPAETPRFPHRFE